MSRHAMMFCLVLFLNACRRDMYDQPRYKTGAQNDFFADGASARPLPAHVVPVGTGGDTEYDQGMTEDGRLMEAFPVAITREVLERGRERFDIYCSVCHGRTGEGNGMIVQRGFPAPPSLHTERLRDAPPGHFFEVITHGYGVMYSYASRVKPADRWAIAAYIRALQLSRHALITNVPSEKRSTLENP